MVSILGDDRCLGFRFDRQSEYKWVTYEEVDMERKREKLIKSMRNILD